MYNQAAWDIANELEAFYAQPRPTVLGVPIAFDMSTWAERNTCGTAACLAGSIIALRQPKTYEAYISGQLLHGKVPRPWTVAADLLGLDEDTATFLFVPRSCRISEVTIQEAIATLRIYAETGDIDWSHAESYEG